MAHKHERRLGGFQLRLGDRRIVLRRQTRYSPHPKFRHKMARHNFRGLFRSQDSGMKNRRHLRLASRGGPGHLLDLLLS
jgi:hypothetical protein